MLFDAGYSYCAVDPRHGRYLSAFVMARGRIIPKEFREEIDKLSSKNSSYLTEWIPNNIKYSLIEMS